MTEMIPLSTTDRLRVIADVERRNAQKIEQCLLRICEAIFN